MNLEVEVCEEEGSSVMDDSVNLILKDGKDSLGQQNVKHPAQHLKNNGP